MNKTFTLNQKQIDDCLESSDFNRLFGLFATEMEHLDKTDTDTVLCLASLLSHLGYYEKATDVMQFLEKSPFLKEASLKSKIYKSYLECAHLHLEANQKTLAMDFLRKASEWAPDTHKNFEAVYLLMADDQPASALSELESTGLKDDPLYFLLKGLLLFQLNQKSQAQIFWEKAKKIDQIKEWLPIIHELEQLPGI